jgi:hypothetical protein
MFTLQDATFCSSIDTLLTFLPLNYFMMSDVCIRTCIRINDMVDAVASIERAIMCVHHKRAFILQKHPELQQVQARFRRACLPRKFPKGHHHTIEFLSLQVRYIERNGDRSVRSFAVHQPRVGHTFLRVQVDHFVLGTTFRPRLHEARSEQQQEKRRQQCHLSMRHGQYQRPTTVLVGEGGWQGALASGKARLRLSALLLPTDCSILDLFSKRERGKRGGGQKTTLDNEKSE